MANQSNQGSGKQGFASMDPNKQREIASEGGKASHGGTGSGSSTSSSKSERGGSSEQHSEAGRQSHKND
jgi:general stress protein YciG